jgi:hypothetical protein
MISTVYSSWTGLSHSNCHPYFSEASWKKTRICSLALYQRLSQILLVVLAHPSPTRTFLPVTQSVQVLYLMRTANASPTKQRQANPEQTASFVKYMYQQVHNDFVAWNHAFCMEKIDRLDRRPATREKLIFQACVDDITKPNHTSILLTSGILEPEPESNILNNHNPTLNHSQPSVYEVDYDSGEYLSLITYDIIIKPILAHEPYESVTPANLCDLVGDDPNAMPFLPLSEDSSFDIVHHTEHYGSFDWQESLADPDRKSFCHSALFIASKVHRYSGGRRPQVCRSSFFSAQLQHPRLRRDRRLPSTALITYGEDWSFGKVVAKVRNYTDNYP